MEPARKKDVPATKALRERVEALYKEKRYAEALLPAQELYSTSVAALGAEHADAINGATNLGILHGIVGDKLRAELWCRRALQGATKGFGPDDARTVKIAARLKKVAGEKALEGQTPGHITALAKKASDTDLPLACPACGRSYQVSPVLNGKRITCLDCHTEFDGQAQPQTLATAPEETPEAVSVLGQPDAEQQSGFPFASDTEDYSFSVPTEGWVRQSPREERDSGADLFIEHPNIGAIKVVISEWQLDFDDLAEGIEEAWKSEINHYSRITIGRTTIAGLPAVCAEYEGTEEGSTERIKFLAHAFLRDKKVFQVFGIAGPITFPRAKKEASAAVKSWSFDPQKATAVRGSAPVRKMGVAGGLASRIQTLPTDVGMVFQAGIKWGIAGLVIGFLLGLEFAGSANGIIRKLLVLVLTTAMGGAVTASFKWGAIAGATSGGVEVIDTLIRISCIPFHIFEVFFRMFGLPAGGMARLMTEINRLVWGIISCVAAGVPYVIYATTTKRIQVDTGTYVGMVIVGGVGGLIALAILMSLAGIN